MGTHIVAEYYGVDFHKLDNEQYLVDLLKQASEVSGMTVLTTSSWKFQPSGVTAIVLLQESHASIHSYPHENRCHIDLFTCGDGNPYLGMNFLKSELKPQNTDVSIIRR